MTGTGLRDRRRRQVAAISTAEFEADTLYAPAVAEAMTVRREHYGSLVKIYHVACR